MKIIKILLIVIVLTLFSTLAIYFEKYQVLDDVAGGKKYSLRLQWLHQAQFAGFYVAKDKGFYRDEGIDLTINSGGQDFNALHLVASGSDDFGIWTADQVLIARQQEIPITPVGTVFEQSLVAYMVLSESGITRPKDFEGKTVGMYYGYDSETIYRYLLKQYNVDESTIKETALQYDLARFFSGDVDVWPAYVINQPIVAELKGIPVKLITPGELGIEYYSDTIIVKDEFLDNSPEDVTAFLRASEKGWRYALSNIDEAIEITMKYDAHLDKTHQTRMLEVLKGYIKQTDPMFAMENSRWKSIQTILLEQGLLKSPQDIGKILRANGQYAK